MFDYAVDLGIAAARGARHRGLPGARHGIAAALAGEGVRVAVSSRSRERIDAARRRIGATGFVLDSADLDAVPGWSTRSSGRSGPVDILVTNTGGPPPNPDALAFSRAEWEDAYRDLTLVPAGPDRGCCPACASGAGGAIVGVSSIAVREPIGPLVLSNAHRSATLAAFKTLAAQVAGEGVTLNSVLPGRIATDRLLELGGSREQVGAGRSRPGAGGTARHRRGVRRGGRRSCARRGPAT